MKYLLVVYMFAVMIGLGGLAQAMTTDEVASIWYTTPKKLKFRALDRGLASTTTSSGGTTWSVHTGSAIAPKKSTSQKSTSVTVDVRKALNQQVISFDADSPSSTTQQTWGVQTWGQSDLIYLNDWQYVDVSKVRDTWLQWTNYLRTEQLGDRGAYSSDWRLNMTAQAWSDYSASIGSISHRRKASDWYYNYNWLVQWFKDRWQDLTGSPIVFRNVSRATFSESIWRWMWSCKEADCTDEVTEATRSTWNFFYGERAANGVHYRALTHKLFEIQWLGIAFSGKKYFLTIHYGTSIID